MKFKLFDWNRDGKGVEKGEDTTPNVGFYYKSLWRKFPKLISINLIMILQWLPILIAVLLFFWSEKTPTAAELSFPAFYGIYRASGAGSAGAILATVTSYQLRIPLFTLKTVLPIVLLLLFEALTFGFFNVGTTYILREMLRGNPVFLFSDFKYAVKKNFRQGFALGLIDFVILGILAFDYFNMPPLGNGLFTDFMFFGIVGVTVIYLIMRFYMYLMLITFDIKISKIFKNALIFVVLGIKRTILALLWIIVLLAFNFVLFMLYMPLGIALPVLYFFSVTTFTTAYAAYPVIQKYMIDPYVKPEPKHYEDE